MPGLVEAVVGLPTFLAAIHPLPLISAWIVADIRQFLTGTRHHPEQPRCHDGDRAWLHRLDAHDSLIRRHRTVRVGLHTGEIELRGDDIGGMTVSIASRVSALARAGEVLVSRTVTDLVAGSGLSFDDRGSPAAPEPGAPDSATVLDPWRGVGCLGRNNWNSEARRLTPVT
jgi:hypothetical protein